jgi:hypothetical protein
LEWKSARAALDDDFRRNCLIGGRKTEMVIHMCPKHLVYAKVSI